MSETPAAKSPRSWSNRILVVLFAAIIVPMGASLLYVYPPTEYGFYPRCFFFWATGFHCPGCGVTRCVGALVRGNVEQAFAYNALFVLVLPFLICGLSGTAYEMWTGKKTRSFRLPGWTLKVFLVVMLIYWIARNIDMYPFNLLAPHEI